MFIVSLDNLVLGLFWLLLYCVCIDMVVDLVCWDSVVCFVLICLFTRVLYLCCFL